MGRPNQATKAKRDRERSRQELQQHKREKRSARSEQKKDRDRVGDDGVDPDLVGIIAGPQPLPEGW